MMEKHAKRSFAMVFIDTVGVSRHSSRLNVKGAYMERRGQTRIALDLPYFIELQFPGLDPVSAILMDISSGGLQVALPPQFPDPVAF